MVGDRFTDRRNLGVVILPPDFFNMYGWVDRDPILDRETNVAGNLKRIEQTAKAQLEELIDLGDRFNDAYDRYLQALAPAVQTQLILATYQLCTRGYPEHFLALSVDERTSAQSQLQQLAKQIRHRFEEYFEPDDSEFEASESDESESEPSEPQEEAPYVAEIATEQLGSLEQNEETEDAQTSDDRDPNRSTDLNLSSDDRDPAQSRENSPEEALRSPSSSTNEAGSVDRLNPSHLANISTWRIEDLTSAKLKQLIRDQRSRETGDITDPRPSQDAEPYSTTDNPEEKSQPRPTLSDREAKLIALALEAKLRAEADDDGDDDDDEITTPNNLRAWQRSIESDIIRMLHQASVQTNQLLHQCQILPQEFPLGLLDAFGQGEGMAEIPSGTPNLLKLTIKSGGRNSEEFASKALQLVAINLNLAEIEFADAAVSQARHRIRQLLAELSGLRKRYAANQKEYTIAKAEAAWRSTWSKE